MSYWNANYWQANYWSANYWAVVDSSIIGNLAASTTLEGPPPPNAGAIWSDTYWSSTYWGADYWGEGGGSGSGGTVFTGTFTAPQVFTGTLSAEGASATAAFVGGNSQVQLFDLDVGWSIQWQFTETTSLLGTIAVTTEDHAAAITGQFSEDFIGDIASTLEDHSANLDGTHVAPANRAGTIPATLQDHAAVFAGANIDPGGAIGSIVSTMDDVTATLTGQYITSNTGGTLSAALDDVTADINGVFAASGTVLGILSDTISFTATFTGTNTNPVPRITANHTIEPVDPGYTTEEPSTTHYATFEAA